MGATKAYRAPFAIHVTTGDPDEGPSRDMVLALGRRLYHHLTRPLFDVDLASPDPQVDQTLIARSLGYSPAVPVRIGHRACDMDTALADRHLVVTIDDDSEPPCEPDDLAIRRVRLTRSHNGSDALDAVYGHAMSMLAQASVAPRLYVCAAPDSELAQDCVTQLGDTLRRLAPSPFAGVKTLSSLKARSDLQRQGALIIAFRDEGFSQTSSCTADLLWAKSSNLPVLEVMAIQSGERRSAQNLSNVPTVLWQSNAPQVVRRAAVEWIQNHVFLTHAERLLSQYGLPRCTVRARPPEPLDLTALDEEAAAGSVIFHPDPELPLADRRALLAVNRRVRFLTPTTAFRFLQRGRPSDGVDPFDRARPSPLDGSIVGLSLSAPDDGSLRPGIQSDHIDDAVAAIVRSVVSAGAAVGYGGDLRAAGYTHLIASLLESYGRRAPKTPCKLVSWLDADLKPGDASNIEYRCLSDRDVPDGPALLLPAQAKLDLPSAYSDKRRVMAKGLRAAVFLGGKITPCLLDDGGECKKGTEQGYLGPFPGLLEEAWRLAADPKPFYLVGGFGGAAAAIVQMALSGRVPSELTEARWFEPGDAYSAHFDRLRKSDWRKTLGLPHTIEDMASELLDALLALLHDDAAAIKWNGLTLADNERLMTSSDPQLVAGLVLQGLTTVTRTTAGKKLSVELIQGDILAAPALDVLSLPGVRGLPFSGAAGHVDDILGGRMSAALQDRVSLLRVEESRLPAEWLHIVALDKREDSGPEFTARASASELVALARRHGFVRIGVVLYGGAIMDDIDTLVDEMVDAIKALGADATVLWYELNPSRFGAIEERLKDRWPGDVDLRVSAGDPPLMETSSQQASIFLDYDYNAQQLRTVLFPPGGGPLVTKNPVDLDDARMLALSKGDIDVDPDTGQINDPTPRYYPASEIEARGRDVAQLLFGDRYPDQLRALAGVPVEVAVDRYTSSIPVETMNAPGQVPPVVGATFNRRLTVPHSTPEQLLTKPIRRGRLRAVVVMSDGDMEPLPNARHEAEVVANALEKFATVDRVFTPKARPDAVLDAISNAHIFHYCGHGYFVGRDSYECGLNLDGGDVTTEDLASLSHFPRLTFMSACDVGRMKALDGQSPDEKSLHKPASFAESFLRSGAQAYIGAHWTLADRSAIAFCETYYAAIQNGATVAEAVCAGRKFLYDNGPPGKRFQWPNYLLYGQGSLRLCSPA